MSQHFPSLLQAVKQGNDTRVENIMMDLGFEEFSDYELFEAIKVILTYVTEKGQPWMEGGLQCRRNAENILQWLWNPGLFACGTMVKVVGNVNSSTGNSLNMDMEKPASYFASELCVLCIRSRMMELFNEIWQSHTHEKTGDFNPQQLALCVSVAAAKGDRNLFQRLLFNTPFNVQQKLYYASRDGVTFNISQRFKMCESAAYSGDLQFILQPCLEVMDILQRVSKDQNNNDQNLHNNSDAISEAKSNDSPNTDLSNLAEFGPELSSLSALSDDTKSLGKISLSDITALKERLAEYRINPMDAKQYPDKLASLLVASLHAGSLEGQQQQTKSDRDVRVGLKAIAGIAQDSALPIAATLKYNSVREYDSFNISHNLNFTFLWSLIERYLRKQEYYFLLKQAARSSKILNSNTQNLSNNNTGSSSSDSNTDVIAKLFPLKLILDCAENRLRESENLNKNNDCLINLNEYLPQLSEREVKRVKEELMRGRDINILLDSEIDELRNMEIRIEGLIGSSNSNANFKEARHSGRKEKTLMDGMERNTMIGKRRTTKG